MKKSVFKNFTKFTGKQLRQSFFFNKVADLRLETLLKERLWHRCFPVNFANHLRTPFFTEHLPWLLLKCETFLLLSYYEPYYDSILKFYIYDESKDKDILVFSKNHLVKFYDIVRLSFPSCFQLFKCSL